MLNKKELLVIALGGNALISAKSKGCYQDHVNTIKKTANHLLPIFKSNNDIVITHGNGPQIGNILIQNEEASQKVPPMPVDVCVAESQGEIGYLLQQSFTNVLIMNNINKNVFTIITHVLVDENDKAFDNPTKPVGPYYDYNQARKIIKEKRWKMLEDPTGKGYRRVLPSPFPIRILETRIIHQLLFQNNIPIAVGGGGIPVIANKNGTYMGIEAVIDKDLASARLAIDLKADKFIILTNVPNCYLNYNKKSQIPIRDLNLDEAQTYLEQGQFQSGSMGPKVESAIEFLLSGGKEAIITSIGKVVSALEKEAGTFIHH